MRHIGSIYLAIGIAIPALSRAAIDDRSTMSIRNYSARIRTTAACAKLLYKQRMTSST
jgi:hypothetical protein